jgi:hypothetical protein
MIFLPHERRYMKANLPKSRTYHFSNSGYVSFAENRIVKIRNIEDGQPYMFNAFLRDEKPAFLENPHSLTQPMAETRPEEWIGIWKL